MPFDAKKLYELLPAVYRIRDAELAGSVTSGVESEEQRLRRPLYALLSVIAEQTAILEEDLKQLYDDLFIETCREWVVPYIGDLVGARGLTSLPDGAFSARAQVANTIKYRRRKGTAAVLEQLARDVTNWPASVVEYFQRLATTQYMNHLRSGNIAMANLRDALTLTRVDTPFDTTNRTVDVRNIESRCGKHNIPNVGIFLYRLESYPLRDTPAFKVDDRRYKFDVLGRDTALYNKPETETEITHLAEPINVPLPIGRRLLHEELDTYYGVEADADPPSLQSANSILIERDGQLVPGTAMALPPHDRVVACDLRDLHDAGGHPIGWAHEPTDAIGVDPVLGRIAFPTSLPPPQHVRVSYHYGFSAEIGGGEYGRATGFGDDETRTVVVPRDTPTLQAAVDQLAMTGGVVEIEDNERYEEALVVRLGARAKIELRAADERRPTVILKGGFVVFGEEEAELCIDGLLVSGGPLVVPKTAGASAGPNRLRRLTIRHCTVLGGLDSGPASSPPDPTHALRVDASNLTVEIDRSIVGGITSVDSAHVQLANAIVDGGDETGLAYAAPNGRSAGATLEAKNTTIIGRVHAAALKLVSNSILLARLDPPDGWAAPVWADRVQQGCIRYSFLPIESRVPRRYECRPDPAEPTEAGRMTPTFTSLTLGDAGYCQLDQRTDEAVRNGADDGGEMGAFHDLYQPQREARLRARVDEYLRFGLEAGIFCAS